MSVRKPRPPANGIASYWSKRERDFETWHDRQPADGHWMNQVVMEGMRSVVVTEEERKLGIRLDALETGRRFRAQCVARGFDPDTFRVSLKRKI